MSDQDTILFDIHVGCLRYGMMRSLLRSLAWRGFRIEWIEGDGLLSRDFTIRCDRAGGQELEQCLQQLEDRA
jgi:hypothetical protein